MGIEGQDCLRRVRMFPLYTLDTSFTPAQEKDVLLDIYSSTNGKQWYQTRGWNSSNNRAIFVWPWKMVSVSVRYLFYQPMDEKIKTWPLSFPAKENPNMEKALFDWPIVLQYDVKAKYGLVSRKFSGMKFFHPSVRLTNQKPPAFVCVR